MAPDYILVEKDVEKKFIDELKNAVNEFFPNLSSENPDFAHIASDRMFQRMKDLLASTNGTVEMVHGEIDDKSRFFPPTIVSGVDSDDALMKDELFGPILPVVTINDVETEGVNFVIDNHDTPLALYVFTGDKQQGENVVNRTRSGGAMVNDCVLHVGVMQVPFGGVGTSGMGSYHGQWGFDEFSHKRTVLRQPWFAEALIKIRYPPYSKKKTDMLSKLSLPSVWYKRDGPVRRSLIRRIFTSKVFFVLAALFGLLFAL